MLESKPDSKITFASEDPTIFAWSIINEPRCKGDTNYTVLKVSSGQEDISSSEPIFQHSKSFVYSRNFLEGWQGSLRSWIATIWLLLGLKASLGHRQKVI